MSIEQYDQSTLLTRVNDLLLDERIMGWAIWYLNIRPDLFDAANQICKTLEPLLCGKPKDENIIAQIRDMIRLMIARKQLG